MAKTPTFPIIIDRCYTVSIGDMKRWGCLNPGQHRRGTVYWERGGKRVASIGYTSFISLEPGEAYIQFNYKYGDNPIQLHVPLLSVSSNIGKGRVWFFRCPATGKRCKKLHLIDGRFTHRSAVQNALYRQQTQSKRWRKVSQIFDACDLASEIWEEIHKPYFKGEYRGKYTRKGKRLIKKMDRLKYLKEAM